MKYLIAALLLLCPVSASASSDDAFERANATMHEDMDIRYTGDVDTDFVRGMIPHHQGAIDMAKVALKYGQDPSARWLAQWIVYIQEQEIAQMRHWLTRFGVPEGQRSAYYNAKAVAEFTQQMADMHRQMDIVFTGDADVDMIMGMIPHHQAAIDMAYTQLKYGKHPALEPLVWGIIRSQHSEIAYMKRWLARRGIDYDATHAKHMQRNAHKQHTHTHHH